MTSSNQSEYAKSIFRPNITGTAYERHQKYVRDYVDVYGSSSQASSSVTKRTDFDVLREQHRFLRDEAEASSSNLPWEENLAAKYEASLYKEFAVCDLKHYKSGGVALRWRTEDEVIAGTGETTCANSRCEHHNLIPKIDPRVDPPKLATLEVPFAYVEREERRSALVKLVLCPSCVNKLMYKRRKEREVEGKTSSPHDGKDENDEVAVRERKDDHRQLNHDREGREEKDGHSRDQTGRRGRERGREKTHSRSHIRRSASPLRR